MPAVQPRHICFRPGQRAVRCLPARCARCHRVACRVTLVQQLGPMRQPAQHPQRPGRCKQSLASAAAYPCGTQPTHSSQPLPCCLHRRHVPKRQRGAVVHRVPRWHLLSDDRLCIAQGLPARAARQLCRGHRQRWLHALPGWHLPGPAGTGRLQGGQCAYHCLQMHAHLCGLLAAVLPPP